jgi:hypothetical protein
VQRRDGDVWLLALKVIRQRPLRHVRKVPIPEVSQGTSITSAALVVRPLKF